MDWFQVVLAAFVINSIRGVSLKCGEEIIIHRGEQKVLRFWSSEDELLNVDVLSKTRGGGGVASTGAGVGGGGSSGAGATWPSTGRYPSHTGSNALHDSRRPAPGNEASEGDFYYAYGSKLPTLSPAAAPPSGAAGAAHQQQHATTTTELRGQSAPPAQQGPDGSQHDGLGVNKVFSDDSIIYDFETTHDHPEDDERAEKEEEEQQGPPVGAGGQEDDTSTATLTPPRQEEASHSTHEPDGGRIDDTPQTTHQDPVNAEDQEASESTTLGPQAQEASVGPTRFRPQIQDASVGPTRLRPQTQDASVGPTRFRPQTQDVSVGPTRLRPQTQDVSVGPTRFGPQAQDASVGTQSTVVANGAAGPLEQDNTQAVSTQGLPAQVKTPEQERQQPDAGGLFTDDAEPTTDITVRVTAQDAPSKPAPQDKQSPDEATAMHPTVKPATTPAVATTEAEPYTKSNAQGVAEDAEDWPTADQHTTDEGEASTEASVARTQRPADGDLQTAGYDDLMVTEQTTIATERDPPTTPVTEGYAELATFASQTEAQGDGGMAPGHTRNEVHLAEGLDETTTASDGNGDPHTYSTSEPEYDVTQITHMGPLHHTTEVPPASAHRSPGAASGDAQVESVTQAPGIVATDVFSTVAEVPITTDATTATEPAGTAVPPTTDVPDGVVLQGSREEQTTGESVMMEFPRTDQMEEAADLSQSTADLEEDDSSSADTGDAGEQITAHHPVEIGQEVLAGITDEPSTGVRDAAEDVGGAEFDATSEATTEATNVESKDEILGTTLASGDATEEAVTQFADITENPRQATGSIREGGPTDTEGKPVTYTTEAALRGGSASDTTEVMVDNTDSEVKLDHMLDGGQRAEVTAGDVSEHDFDGYDDQDTYHFFIDQEETKETWEDAQINDDGEMETTTSAFSTREEPGDVGEPEKTPATGSPAEGEDVLADTQSTTENFYFQDTLAPGDRNEEDLGATDARTQQPEDEEESVGDQNLGFDTGTSPAAAADSTLLTDPSGDEGPKTDAGDTAGGGGDLGVGGSGAAKDTPTVLKTTGSSSSDDDHDSHGDIFDAIIEQLTEDLERGAHETHAPVEPFFLDINSLLREEPTTAEELGTSGAHDAPAPQLTLGHQETESSFKDDPKTEDEVTTASDVPTHTLAPGSFAMGGFMDLSMAAMLDDTTRSTTDLTEAPTEALTTTAPAEERTEGAPTVALDYDYPNITEDDSFKGYDYYEHLVDSLTAQDSPYKDEEEGQRKTSGTEPHEADAAPDAELTNLEFSAVDSLATMVSTKNSAREDLDEGNQDPVMTGEQVTGDSEGATTTEGPSTEEPDSTTSTPATDGYADEATATPDVDGDATTAFSVPLVVLRNQEMLNDLLNTQGVSGASKVVIREQGSKVAINHPAHQKHDPQLHDTTAGASSHVDASAAAPSGTSAVVQDDTLQTNATNPEVAEVGSPAGAVQTPDTRDQDETPATSSSAENQDTTTITTPTTSSSAENQDTTTIDDDLTDLRQHLGAFQTTAATAADDVTDEGVDETTTSSVATDGTTQNPELATILIPYSFVQYLGHASGGSQGQDAPRDPVAQEEHLQSQHRGEDTPGDGDQERPAYGEGISVDGEDSHYGEGSYGDGRPLTDGEVSLNYGEGSSAYSEKGPLQDGEPGFDHGEGSSVYGAEKPPYSEGVRPVRGETQPVYGDGVALDGEASPGDGDSPIDGEISLANSGVNPSYGEDSTAHVETRLGYGDEESIVHDALYPVNREKESEHSASRPTNGEDSLAYGDASLAYGDASPDHSEPRPQQEGPVRGEGAQSHDGQESLVYGDRLAYGEESLAYGDQRPSYGEDSVYGDEARPAYGEGSVYGDDAEPAYGEGGVAYGEVARPVYGDGSVYGDGARPMYGEESAGRPVYDVDGNPAYGGVERVSYGGGGSPAYGSDGGSVSGGPVGGGISRKDDAGLTDYGGESPFFIKLPGSPNAVPVYLEYEPVQVKYVSSERTDEYAHNASSPGGVAGIGDEDVGLQEREDESGSVEDVTAPSGTSPHGSAPDAAQVESEVRENATQEEHSSPPSGNDSLSATLMNGIYRILDNVAVAVNNQFSEEAGGPKQQDEANFIPHKPFGERPDPFFLMEAPQLGEHNSHQPPPQPPPLDANHTDGGATDDGKEESYSVDVSGKLGFDGGEGAPGTKESVGTVEDVPIGLKQEILYPGDYYSHHAYTGVNLSSLINPVFDLSTKPTTESHEDRMNPQYTPFPITTNPPRRMTPRPVHALLGPQRTRGQESGSSPVEMPKPVASTETPVTKGLASVEYSPIPAADFHDSYDASYIPGYFYEQENRIQPPTGDPAVGKDAFHGPRSPADEGVAVALDDTRRVSAAPYKITDDAALTLASLTSATLTAQDASGGTAPTAAQAAAAGEEEEEEATASGSNVPPPSDHFTAHQQVWSFPQSREEPGGQEDPVPYDPVPYDPVHHAPTTRTYTAFYSPREIPGIDPSIFGYRKVPQEGSSALVPTYDLPEAQEEEEVVPTAAGGGPNPGPAHQALLGPQFFKYLNSLPYALLRKFLDPSNAKGLDDADLGRAKRSSAGSRSGRQILCEWNVKTEPGLYLLMTFHNLSAPYTVDCHGAYIEVERENNGYDARWCGNRVYQAGTRPHVIFAKTEVRINVFDDGDITKSLPTGFESDIEVIDLFNADDYDAFMRSSAYPHIRRLLLG